MLSPLHFIALKYLQDGYLRVKSGFPAYPDFQPSGPRLPNEGASLCCFTTGNNCSLSSNSKFCTFLIKAELL